MSFNPEYILLALAPVFFLFIFWEWRWLQRHPELTNAQYSLKDTVSNATLAFLHQVGELIAAVAILSVYTWFFDWRLFDIPMTWWSLAFAFVLQDFLYYWFHRCSHQIRWLWAAHVVHHSSEHLNFSTAFRQSLMYPVAGMWAFWIPMAVVGFAPETIIMVVLLNLGYQFFVHTQAVRRLGVLEHIFNTPSHHRVHHASNPEYIDRNYAGVLIIWDKFFGTFVPEQDDNPCVYGITKPVRTHNPITLTFHEWRDMLRDATAPNKRWQDRIGHLVKRPDWAPQESNK
ncbi:sterol desaturase family protein [Salinispirillum sp. LH 10-3-1]|uniref:Sterol desaturase family protein n=1 Tax=Salinispirillum sp. LH 10-3-1 TaxID=2952525 RepID=A0AB38YJE9_9GAMM